MSHPPVARVVVLLDLGERFNGYRPPLFEKFGRWETLLEATLARLLASDLPPIVVCCKDVSRADPLMDRLGRLNLRLLEVQGATIDAWLGRALDAEAATTAIVVDARAVFVAPDLLRGQLTRHWRVAAEITLPSLAVPGLGGIVIEHSVIARLSRDEAMARHVDLSLTLESFLRRYSSLYRVAHVESSPALQSIVADLLPRDAADVHALSDHAMAPDDQDYTPVIAQASARAWAKWPLVARAMGGRPKILFAHYTTSMRPGSSQTFLYAVKGWDRAKYDVVVAVPGSGPLVDELTDVAVRELSYSSVANSLEGGPGFQLEELERCRRLLEEEKPALVFVSNPAPLLAMACRLAGVPVVCHLKLCFWLGPESARDPFARMSMLPSYDLVIVNSHEHESGLRRLVQAPEGRLACVPDGIAVDAFTRSPALTREAARRALGLPVEGDVVLLIGNIGPHKRTALAADVLSHLLAERPNAYIAVVGAERGSPGYQALVEARAAELGVTDRLLFLGHRDDVHSVYTAGDVLLHLCLVESFGLVMAEAMSMELPVVAVASGGATEVVEHGVTGTLVSPPGEPETLARAVAEVLRKDPTERRAVGLAGRRRTEERFEVRVHVARLEQLCATLLGRRGSVG